MSAERPLGSDIASERRLGLAMAGLIGLLVSGCRGPTPEEIAGVGVRGSVLFGVVSLAALTGVVRVWQRLRYREWRPTPTWAGTRTVLLSHAGVSVVAFIFADGGDELDLWPIVWGCAAAHHLACSLVVWRVSQFGLPRAVLVAAVPALALGFIGGLGVRSLAELAVIQWFLGGYMGAVPAGIIVLLWLEAWLRGRFELRHGVLSQRATDE